MQEIFEWTFVNNASWPTSQLTEHAYLEAIVYSFPLNSLKGAPRQSYLKAEHGYIHRELYSIWFENYLDKH